MSGPAAGREGQSEWGPPPQNSCRPDRIDEPRWAAVADGYWYANYWISTDVPLSHPICRSLPQEQAAGYANLAHPNYLDCVSERFLTAYSVLRRQEGPAP